MPRLKNFELACSICGSLLSTSLLFSDPDTGKTLCPVLLVVDWKKKKAEVAVKSRKCTDSMLQDPFDEYKATTIYEIPQQVNSNKLKAYHDEHIRPVLLEIAKAASDPVQAARIAAQDGRVEELLRQVPCHNKKVYRDVRDVDDVAAVVAEAEIDFLTADLTDRMLVRRIRNVLEEHNVIVYQNEFNFRRALIEMQEKCRSGKSDV